MSLLLKIVDGQPVDHPVYEGNLLQYYAEVPPEYKPFVRVQRPNSGPFVIYPEQSEYQFIDGFWTDVWVPITLTQEQINEITERVTLQQNAKRDLLVEQANLQMESISDPTQLQVWQNYVSQLQDWQLQSVDPITPDLPKRPKLIDGVWIATP